VVPCSSTELKVLAALLQAKGRVLTRRQIIDNVWGTQTFITERVVDNHVLSLRKKIEVDPERPQLLVSVRGVGYRFDATP
jgi:DNA-binding response OmpR family regulator